MTRGKTSIDATKAPAKPTASRGWVAFVGSGPGDPGLLTVRAADLLREADVVITETPEHEALVRAVRGEVSHEAGPEFVDGGFGEDGQPLTHAARAKVVVKQAKRGLRVVRLMAGDPFLYASGPEEALACAKAGLCFEVVPGVSSLASVPAYAGIPLTTKDHRELDRRHLPREGRLEPVRRQAAPSSCCRPCRASARSPRRWSPRAVRPRRRS